jgi:hypothetical protein
MIDLDYTFVPGEYIVFTEGVMKVLHLAKVLKPFNLKQVARETLTDDPDELYMWMEALNLIKLLPFRRAAARNINGKLNPVVFPTGAQAALIRGKTPHD